MYPIFLTFFNVFPSYLNYISIEDCDLLTPHVTITEVFITLSSFPYGKSLGTDMNNEDFYCFL